jgi:NTE family protein
MFAWLRNRKLKPTAEVALAQRPDEPGRSPGRPFAAGALPDARDFDSLPPHPLLSLLPGRTLKRLLAEGAVGEYKKGTPIFRAGDECDAIYLVLSGRCEVREAEAGTIVGPGDLMGARSLLNRERHRASATVVTHAVLLRLPAQEFTGLFKSDPSIAGRFSETVTARRERDDLDPAVRRIVALLPLIQRADVEAIAWRLGRALHKLAGQRVLIAHLVARNSASNGASPLDTPVNGGDFSFSKHLTRSECCDELFLTARGESRDVAAVAPLLGHCGRHYDYVLLQLAPDLPVQVCLEALIQCDLAYALLGPAMQNLYDFQLLLRELRNQTPVAPILLADETLAAPETKAALTSLGHPVHSVMRGFPIRGGAPTPDHRFDLAINRLAREIGRCRLGLALSSGSAKGLAHIGVIQVLEENGIEIDCVAGASMGAYVGAIWASGLDGQRLEKVSHETGGRWGYLRLLAPAIPPRRGFLRTRRAAARLRRTIEDAHFSDLLIPLRVIATHLDTLERVVFSSGAVAPAVEASIAIPGVCVPVTLDGQTYIDGGIADPLPVDVLVEMGIEKIIAVNVIPPPERIRYWLDAKREKSGREHRKGFGKFLRRHLDYGAKGNILDTMMRAINGAQTRVAEAAARESDLVIRPLSCEAVWHDFSDPKSHIALGRAEAEARLPELKALARANTHDPQPTLAEIAASAS